MASVKLEQVRKAYEAGGRERVAVHGLDLEVADGEFCVLVGPSGCGKSTTLRLVAGLEVPTAGRVFIGPREVSDLPPKERDIALVFQNYALYPHMTAFENMAFALRLRGMPRPEIAQRVHQAAAMLGLEELLERRPRQLSGGERQRVALGRAIVRQPQVFLFDEPLSNLDAKLRLQMRREIAALHRRLGATMIYVTHDQVEAMTLGDRIVVLNQGRVQQIASPMELYRRPQNVFVAGFIGSPAMNLAEGVITREDPPRVLLGEGGPVLEPAAAWRAALASRAGRSIMVGIRPESLRLAGEGEPGLPGEVELAEPLGNETLLHVRAGERTWTARLAPGAGLRTGDPVRLTWDPGELHFFDAQSGARVVGSED